jgi:cytoskeletal protein CcmA (bactofilin family)
MKRILIALAAVSMAALAPADAHARRDKAIMHGDMVIEKDARRDKDILTDGSLTVDGTLAADAVSLGGPVTVNGLVTGDVSSMGGPVTINGRAADDVASFGGPITVAGEVAGDVSSMGGSVEVSGHVAGDISSLGGNVTLRSGAVVAGDISTLGGSVVKEDGAAHRGQVTAFDARDIRRTIVSLGRVVNQGEKRISPLLAGGLATAGLIFMVSLLFTGVILLLLPAVFFPAHTGRAADAVRADFWRSTGIGALITVAFFPAMLMLLVSILGIPLIPLALLLLVCAAALGLSGFSVVLQERFFQGIKKTGPASMLGQVLVGYVLMAGLLIFGNVVPLVGGVLSFIGFMMMAFGVVVGLGAAWDTRMGNRAFPAAPAAAAPAAQPAAAVQPPAQEPPPQQ